MHLINSVSVLVASTTPTTAAKATSSTSSSAFLFLIVIVAVAYFVLIRPSRNRRMAAMKVSKAFDLGDEVIAGGMVGHVVRLGEGDVDIEVADGVVVTFVNGAVQSRTAYEARLAPRGGAAAASVVSALVRRLRPLMCKRRTKATTGRQTVLTRTPTKLVMRMLAGRAVPTGPTRTAVPSPRAGTGSNRAYPFACLFVCRDGHHCGAEHRGDRPHRQSPPAWARPQRWRVGHGEARRRR